MKKMSEKKRLKKALRESRARIAELEAVLKRTLYRIRKGRRAIGSVLKISVEEILYLRRQLFEHEKECGLHDVARGM